MKRATYIGLNISIIGIALFALAYIEGNSTNIFKSLPYALFTALGYMVNSFFYLRSHNKNNELYILVYLFLTAMVLFTVCNVIVTILITKFPSIQFTTIESTSLNPDSTPILEQLTPRYFFNSFTRGTIILYLGYSILFTLLTFLYNFILKKISGEHK